MDFLFNYNFYVFFFMKEKYPTKLKKNPKDLEIIKNEFYLS